MKAVITGLVGAVLVSATAALGVQAAGDAGQERGRYEGVSASDNAVWVVDTHTGKVRRCTQEFADQTPTCTAFSGN